MKRTGYTWNQEYREQFYASERVQAHLAEFVEQARLPKSPEQREKMRLAKLGKAKSAEHRARMSEAQKFRHSLKREILSREPQLPIDAVWERVRQEMSSDPT